jgi:hypothetical protein
MNEAVRAAVAHEASLLNEAVRAAVGHEPRLGPWA